MATTDLAQMVAISNGTNLITANKITATRSRLLNNPHPSINVETGVARVIQLLTYYNDNSIAKEKYSIMANFKGLIECSGTKKGIWYFLFPNTSYAIKFYGPDEYDEKYYNHVYAVPAIKNINYVTGFQDYTTSVPQGWVDALVQFANTVPTNTIPNSSTDAPATTLKKLYDTTKKTQKYVFSFNFCGNLSGAIGKSGTFSFQYVFYAGAKPNVATTSTTTTTTNNLVS